MRPRRNESGAGASSVRELVSLEKGLGRCRRHRGTRCVALSSITLTWADVEPIWVRTRAYTHVQLLTYPQEQVKTFNGAPQPLRSLLITCRRRSHRGPARSVVLDNCTACTTLSTAMRHDPESERAFALASCTPRQTRTFAELHDVREAHAALPVTARAEFKIARARHALRATLMLTQTPQRTPRHPRNGAGAPTSLRLTSQAIRLRYENSSDVGVFAKLTNSCATVTDAGAG